MGYQALLFCPDEKLARVVTQVLSDLDFSVETATEPFAAVKKLMAQHFDAVVVDCDNEQNATLLFKSARNSSSNQSSLAVAVVEGQAGVAKAFRIGANLVLTKPINVEQAKGTLRVARGLLRKGGEAKFAPAAPPKPAAPTTPPAPRLAVASDAPKPAPLPVKKPATPAISETKPVPPKPVVAASAGPLEVENDPTPALDAADLAMLESLKDTPPESRSAKEFAWQPPKSQSTPMAAALQRAAEAAGRVGSVPPRPSQSVLSENKPSAASPAAAAAAPALARELFEAPAAEAPSARAPYAEPEIATPSFGAFGADDEDDEGSKSKKPYFIVAAIVIAAATAYYGWSLKHSSPASTPAHAPATAPASSTPAESAPAPAQPAPATAAPVESSRPAEQSEPEERDSTPRTSHSGSAASSKSQLIAEDTVTKVAPIVVKTDLSAPARSTPPPSEPAPQAPSLALTSAGGGAELNSLVASTTVAVPKRSPQTLKISQGVSQGLILKRVQPVYPQQALQMRLQGAVQLLATISKEGSITNLHVLSGDNILARAATDAVRQWKYKPYYLNGEPVEIQTQITVNFKLPN